MGDGTTVGPTASATAARLPDFVVLGAMKSGTTSLAEYLMAHPEAFIPPMKEVAFFDANWHRGVDWYAQQFAAREDELVAGEATPTYLFSPDVPARLAEVVPDAKLIAILRNPVDRAYSHYWHERHRKDRERRTFEAAIADELAGDAAADPQGMGYLARGRYLEQLERFCRHFPRESLLVLLLDDLEGHPEASFGEVCRFIGIDPAIVPENVGGVANAYVEQRALPLWRFMTRHRLWRRMPGPTGRLLARAMVRTNASYESMKPALRATLTEHFAPHNAALGEWLGRDLSMWSGPPPPATRTPRRSADAGVQWWRRR